MRWAMLYYPRLFDRVDPANSDPVQPHEGSGGDLSPGCPRCGLPIGEDRIVCECCRGWEDEPLDTEGE